MSVLCLNSRDELLLVEIEKIAFLQADGNYTRLTYIGSRQINLTMNISGVEKLIAKAVPKDAPGSFIRLGRSLIINQAYLSSISVAKQRVVLSDNAEHTYSLPVPKDTLKEYKRAVAAIFGHS